MSRDIAKNQERERIISECSKDNIEFNKTVKEGFLRQEYIDLFGLDKYCQISCYENIQQQIIYIALTHKENLDVLKKCLDLHINEYGDKDWQELVEKLVYHMNGYSKFKGTDIKQHRYVNEYRKQEYPQFSKLLSRINAEDLTEEDIKTLTNVLISEENFFNINSLEELRDFDNIKEKACRAIIDGNMQELKKYPKILEMKLEDRKRFALAEILFGIDLKAAENIIKKYNVFITDNTKEYKNFQEYLLDNSDIDDPNTQICADYIKSINLILDPQASEKTLNAYMEIAKNMKSKIKTINPIAMEGEIKKTYFREYKKELFDVKNAKKIDGKNVFGDGVDCKNVYDAGLDFNMLVHSLHAYRGGDQMPEDFKEEWNVALRKSQYICTSYIGHDMMGTAQVKYFCLRL